METSRHRKTPWGGRVEAEAAGGVEVNQYSAGGMLDDGVGRDQCFRVLEAKGTRMNMRSRNTGKAEKVKDGEVVGIPDPLVLCNPH